MIIRWKSLQEHRDTYFVEYIPASSSIYLASLVLTYTKEAPSASSVVSDIEKEFKTWLQSFPVPLMATAVDRKGEGIDLSSLKEDRFLVGFIEEGRIQSSWDKLNDSEFPDNQKRDEYRANVYRSLEAVTKDEVDANIAEHRKIVRTGWIIVFVWAVIVPALIAVLGFFNLFWVGILGFLYSLYKAMRKALEMFGVVEKSRATKEKEAENLQMRHHHYHCTRNPKGFIRLRNENFQEDEILEIKNESEKLRKAEEDGGGYVG